MLSSKLPAILVFALTYVGIALGGVPWLRIDRTGIALLGAALMLVIGALTPEEAYRAIDLHTLALLTGMMIVVAHLKVSGVFRALSAAIVAPVHSGRILLVIVTGVTGILSAFLVNDAICLVMAPLGIEIARRLGRDPIPYLLAVATASNLGSVATITGNPQNMIIGVTSAIPYGTFAAVLAPVAGFGLLVVVAVVGLTHRHEFLRPLSRETARVKVRLHRGQAIKAVLVTLCLVIAFFAGVPVSEAAIVAGAMLLVTRGVKPQRIYREIDGSLLLMFAGLFVVVAGFERVIVTPGLIAEVNRVGLDVPWRLTLVTAALSNLVSNVPAVLVLKPFVAGLPDPTRSWLVIAMSSTLAGNLTLLGSVANLIVAEKARAEGIYLTFGAYLRVGLPVTILSIGFGAWWLA